MKFFTLLFYFLLITPCIFGQSENDISRDLLLDDEQFKYKYIKKITQPEVLIREYNNTSNIEDRIAIAYKLCDDLDNETVFNHLILILSENNTINSRLEIYWKLKSIIIYQMGIKAESLSQYKIISIQRIVLNIFKKEKIPRLLAASALTLSRLSPNLPNDNSKHRLLNQRTISYALVEKMLQLKKEDQYLCWVLCKASIINGDPYTLTALHELKKIPFAIYVRKEIKNTIKILEKRDN